MTENWKEIKWHVNDSACISKDFDYYFQYDQFKKKTLRVQLNTVGLNIIYITLILKNRKWMKN